MAKNTGAQSETLSFNCEGCGCLVESTNRDDWIKVSATQWPDLDNGPRIKLFCTDFNNRDRCVGDGFIDIDSLETYLKGTAYARYLSQQ